MERQHLSPTKNSIAPPQTQSHAIARSSTHPIEELQGAIGNRAVNQLLANQPTLQAKPMFRGLSHEFRSNLTQINQPIQAKEADSASVKETHTENKTGLPDNLKVGIENLSGIAMDDVRVHYNSSKPSQLQALAYTQGTDIHVAPGREQHLPHEAWHVMQQMQGRVKPTLQAKGVSINDDESLEHEADVMGRKALQMKRTHPAVIEVPSRKSASRENLAKVSSNSSNQRSTIHQATACSTTEKDLQPTEEDPAIFRESQFHHGFSKVPAYTGVSSVIQRLQIEVPKVADNSSNYLKFRYMALLRSDTFKKEVHKIITSSKEITLELVQGVGTADYDHETHTIRIWRQTATNGLPRNKSDKEIRNDLIFELHNAKKRGEFSRLHETYNIKGLDDDNKNAFLALAMEWIEWFHLAEQVIRIENIRNDTSTDLLTNEFKQYFLTGTWRSFREYLRDQIEAGHTKYYDDKAVDNYKWKGWNILKKIEAEGNKTKILNISQDEFNPKVTGQKPHIKFRINPFTLDSMIHWGFVKKA
jgi:Domain of unknown function (DUF4157)